MGRTRNDKLAALLADAGWTYEACAAAVRAVARENGENLPALHRSQVAYWVAGSRPRGKVPSYVAEAASRRFHRPITVDDLGWGAGEATPKVSAPLDWSGDPVADLVTVGRADLERRAFAQASVYLLMGAALPAPFLRDAAERGAAARARGGLVGAGDVEAVRDMIAALSRVDERQGGGHARRVVVQYLTDDVAAYLDGRFASETVRRAMFSAAAELTYLAGWKSFDSNLQGLAQMYYHRALRLADEADDRGLAGFIVRAMAHQAADLGHGAECVRQADVALDWSRKHRTPAAAALFTVVRARGLAVDRQPVQARATLRHAEGLLARVDLEEEPIWLRRMGFGEASLANQTAQTLRDLGDLGEAERQFQRSTAVRNGGAHRRIHALTLANLAATQCAAGKLGEACANWNDALDHMDGLRSARARVAVDTMLSTLGSLGTRLTQPAHDLRQRALEHRVTNTRNDRA